jgi:hypothetical protein
MTDQSYVLLASTACSLGAYGIRRLAPSVSWLHGVLGLAVLSGVAGVLAAVGDAIRTSGLHETAIVAAISGAIMASIGAANPSNRGDAPRALLPLLFIAAMTLAGCKTAGFQSWKTCELSKLPAGASAAVAVAQEAAADPSSTVASLEQAAMGLAPGQFECALQALLAWWATPSAKGAPSPTRRHEIEVAQAYLSRHTAQCSPVVDRAMRRAVVRAELGADQYAAAMAWAEENFDVGICDRGGDETGHEECRPVVIDRF